MRLHAKLLGVGVGDTRALPALGRGTLRKEALDAGVRVNRTRRSGPLSRAGGLVAQNEGGVRECWSCAGHRPEHLGWCRCSCCCCWTSCGATCLGRLPPTSCGHSGAGSGIVLVILQVVVAGVACVRHGGRHWQLLQVPEHVEALLLPELEAVHTPLLAPPAPRTGPQMLSDGRKAPGCALGGSPWSQQPRGESRASYTERR